MVAHIEFLRNGSIPRHGGDHGVCHRHAAMASGCCWVSRPSSSLDLSISALQESVTVTGEAPLLDVTSSTLGGNIDPRQMQELPVNGRNWMDPAMLAPGSRQNQSSGAPLMRQGYSQINVDGQQVTTNFIGLGDDQPRFSRDAIAEFVLITNRFDATQGRSTGMLVNAITKSGTNIASGSLSGYFRDDSFNAADHIQKRVLPYSNQQVSSTFGGPIRRDRVHFFANYESEREPQTITFDSPYREFNIDFPNTRQQHSAGAWADIQFSPQVRLSTRCRYTTRCITPAVAAPTIRRTPKAKAATPRSSSRRSRR